ncbi:histidine phosphatase family protein [Aquipuribacter sp. MA13-6]|uniref:histidine phosphatase family protein n=1 Tax=unclassified Aquipuribacter TaxID=2635084 RepID=UPI003EE91827
MSRGTGPGEGPATPGGLVVLLRHGETAWNVEHRFQGQHDTDLTDAGRAQAAAAAQALGDAVGARPVRLVSSDLSRARGTAAAAGEALGVPVLLDARLREIAAGRWQGLLQPEIEAMDPEAFAAWRAGDDVVLGGDERPSEAGERVRAAVTEHAEACDEGQLLVVVGHGASIRSGLAALLGQPDLRRVLVPLGNTGTAVLSAGTTRGQAWRLHGWNVPPGVLGEVLWRRAGVSAAVT